MSGGGLDQPAAASGTCFRGRCRDQGAGPVSSAVGSTPSKEAHMLKKIAEFLTLKWLWNRR